MGTHRINENTEAELTIVSWDDGSLSIRDEDNVDTIIVRHSAIPKLISFIQSEYEQFIKDKK
jgi:hypothetical protein